MEVNRYRIFLKRNGVNLSLVERTKSNLKGAIVAHSEKLELHVLIDLPNGSVNAEGLDSAVEKIKSTVLDSVGKIAESLKDLKPPK